MNELKYFTFEHKKSGFTDQLRYFVALCRLGNFMGFSYLHTPFISLRSGLGNNEVQSPHEFIGVNAYFQRIGIEIENNLENYHLIEIDLSNINWQSLEFNNFTKLIDFINKTIKYNSIPEVSKNKPILVYFKHYHANTKKLYRYIFENTYKHNESCDLREIYQHERSLHPRASLFNESAIKILIHIRQGDTSIISTPWATHIPVRSKRKDFLREYSAYEDIEAPDIFTVCEIYEFFQRFINYFEHKNLSILLYSDGWKRAHEIIYKNIEKLNWNNDYVQKLRAGENSYDDEQFSEFSKLGGVLLQVGEEPEKLLNLIDSVVKSDIVFCTSQQAMMPKLVSSLCLQEKPIIIVLYKEKIPKMNSIIEGRVSNRFVYVNIFNPDFKSWIQRVSC